jgi:protein-tyrosine phosphatase/arsenate reductase
MNKRIKDHCDHLTDNFNSIPEARKVLLAKLGHYIQSRLDQKLSVNLVYVCTHNSRRSHFGQVWAAVAAEYYNIPTVKTFSGGTETTAFNPNAIEALRSMGFEISLLEDGTNPVYKVSFGDEASTLCFSKVYDDHRNPDSGFAAIMTCSDAEENCPFMPGADLRIATTYEDPKAFDGTPLQNEKYLERSNQIALECLYVFSLINIPKS